MAISSATQTEILKIVVGLFNAAPGQQYMTDLANAVEGGMSTAELADFLAGHSIFTGGVMAGKVTVESQVEVLMSNFGLTADDVPGSAASQAEEYFTDRIENGDGFGAIVYDAVQYLSGSPAPEFADVAALLANKALVAGIYSASNPSTTLAGLQAILANVTATGPSTPEEVAAYLDEVVIGEVFTLTSGQDTVTGGAGQNIIKGVFGSATASENTLTAGDDIDGGSGVDTLVLTAQGTAASTGAASVSNVEQITIKDVYGATFNALSVEDDPSISFTSTVDDQTSTVTNAALGSVIGLAGAGNLTVDYVGSTTTGTDDASSISLAGVGTSDDNRSAINVADGNTIDSVAIAASGTNYATLTAGTAAKSIIVTGAGTNDITISSVAATLTVDASAATGNNTFNVDTGLSNGDKFIGGAGTDEVTFNATAALGNVTFTDIETLTGDFDINASLNLSGSTGLNTLNMEGSTGNVTVTNAQSDLTAVNITSQGDAGNTFGLSYATGQVGDVTVTLGETDTDIDADIDMGDFTFTRAESLAINAVGVKANDVDDVALLQADSVALSIGVAADGDLSIDSISGSDGMGFSSVDMDVAENGTLYVSWIETSGVDSDIGDINMTVGSGASGQAYWATSDDQGDVGNINLEIASGGSGYLGGSGYGEVGDQTMTVGANASGYIYAYSYNYSGNPDISGGIDGSIGNIDLTVDGASGNASGYFDASGDVGDITMNVSGSGASGEFDAYAYGDNSAGSAGSAGAYGDIGNISMSTTGSGASGYGYAYASGSLADVDFLVSGNGASGYLAASADDGNVGDVTFTLGAGASGEMNIYAYDGGGLSGNVGDITLAVGDDAASGSAYFDASGSVGNITATLGDDVASMYLTVEAYSGGVGNVDVTMGENSWFSGWFSGEAGQDADIGTVTVSAGAGAYIDVGSEGRSTGAIDITAGVDSEVYAYTYANGGTAGSVSITGGSAGDYAYAYASGDGGVDYIDLSGWLGNYDIDTRDVTDGAVIDGGQSGGTIYATDEADVISGGAGDDTIYASGGANIITGLDGDDYLSGGADADTIYGGSGDDIIKGAAGADTLSGGAGDDTIYGGADIDSINGGTGTNTFVFSDVDADTDVVLAAVTDNITGGFGTGDDLLDFTDAGTLANYDELLTDATTLGAFIADADTALDGTVQYYFGVVGSDGYLAYDQDGTGITSIVKITGVTDMAYTDII